MFVLQIWRKEVNYCLQIFFNLMGVPADSRISDEEEETSFGEVIAGAISDVLVSYHEFESYLLGNEPSSEKVEIDFNVGAGIKYIQPGVITDT